MSETTTMHNLLKKGYPPKRTMEIYYKFIYDYKGKHIGQLNVMDPKEWYGRRAEVFDRFINRYYLREQNGNTI
jgi:hypothetical protein